MVLEKIQKANDIHSVPLEEFPLLAEEIRRFLVKTVSENGGHLASNLGVVELTIALHNVLHFPEDKLIWDVGHQAYTHKLLTGRKERFATLRKEGGLSGFPKRAESPCDAFDTGHSSTSISAGLGYVRARDLSGEKYHVVSVIGDGALTGGLAFEALNNAALLKTNFIIVLNDNNMSISRNIGGMNAYLSTIRTAEAYTGMKLKVTKSLNKVPKAGPALVDTVRRTKSSIKQLFIPGMLFENMGLTYLGPVDGHDMRTMMRLFNEAKKVEGPVLVHVLTRKGKGYRPARERPDLFHGTGPFDIRTGDPNDRKVSPSYTDIFGSTVCELAQRNEKVVAITAAMPQGTGLERMKKQFPDRFFDVGIAEAHAATFAAGLALGGMLPVLAVYSSFLQRAFDQLIHDICMQKLHVILAVDRAGLVGADGETHHGSFDLSYLSMIPNMTVMAPKNGTELRDMLLAAADFEGPVAIRYPRGTAGTAFKEQHAPVEFGRAEVLREGHTAALLCIGEMNEAGMDAAALLEKEGYDPTVVNMRFVKPLDTALLDRLAENHSLFVTIEENAAAGGMGEHVCRYMALHHEGRGIRILSLEDRFIPQGKIQRLREENHLSAEAAARTVLEYFSRRGI